MRFPATACVPVLIMLALAITPGSAAAARDCGTIAIDYQRTADEHYSRMRVKVIRGRVTCKQALRLMRRYQDETRPCPSDGGNSCHRRYRDGWGCLSATVGSFPKIQECYRNGPRKVINGYAER